MTFSRTLLVVSIGLLPGFRLSAQSLLPADAGTTVNGFQDNFTGKQTKADAEQRP